MFYTELEDQQRRERDKRSNKINILYAVIFVAVVLFTLYELKVLPVHTN